MPTLHDQASGGLLEKRSQQRMHVGRFPGDEGVTGGRSQAAGSISGLSSGWTSGDSQAMKAKLTFLFV
jgi:hypothetical protein